MLRLLCGTNKTILEVLWGEMLKYNGGCWLCNLAACSRVRKSLGCWSDCTECYGTLQPVAE